MATRKNKLIPTLIIAGLIAAQLCFNIYIYYNSKHVPPPAAISVNDTVTVYKTDTIYKDTTLYVTNFDTIIEYVDSIHNDTIEVPIQLPIQHKEYYFNIDNKDITLNGNIFYHGLKAEIDSVTMAYNYTYNIKKDKFAKSLIVGPSIGVGLVKDNQNCYKFAPFIGISVTYGIGWDLKTQKTSSL